MQTLTQKIKHIAPHVKVDVIQTQYGEAVRIIGKGAKTIAAYFNRERYLDGATNTNWAPSTPRHGLGYIVPLYENPIDALI